MSTAEDKLGKDLEILEAMAKEMEDYLESDTLFMPMPNYADMPNLTIGGYVMRQHRLQALTDLLEKEQQSRLEQATARVRQVKADKPAQFDNKAEQEIAARMRQWEQYLEDLESGEDSLAYYKSAVETRVMIADLMKVLYDHPAEVKFTISERLRKLDERLNMEWEPGEFVWPDAWKPAYPQERYLWLYGQPV